jgi:hypothetical protein
MRSRQQQTSISFKNLLHGLCSQRSAMKRFEKLRCIFKSAAEMIPNSQAVPVLNEIEQRIKQRNYYAILSGADDIHRGRKWKVMPTVFEIKRMIVGHTLRVNATDLQRR